ncbi:MAG TPA: Rieske 2Fe-2S domain-containing protein [Verrucomicrobiae bacterium]
MASLSELSPDRPLRVRVGRLELALFLLDGQVYALDDRCPHKGGPLAQGFCENGQVSCPLHGWTFDIKTGACADAPNRPAICVPVRVEDGKVFLATSER